MRLDHFDLNLLVAFSALMEERSVTRAAQRLNLTQPAMSAALKRLREAFDDELLVQRGKRMHPTQHALALAPEVHAALVRLRGLIATGTKFDPATSHRQFRVLTSDYITTVLLVPLLSALHQEAPGVRLELTMPTSASSGAIDDGSADLMIAPERFMQGDHPRELLFTERLVVVGCQSNPVMRGEMTREAFLSCGHVSVRIDGRQAYMEQELDFVVPERRVEVIAQSFIQVPWLLRNTNRLAVMHERLAQACAPPLGLRIAPVPFAVSQMPEIMMYHATRTRDPGLMWLRQRLIQVARA